MNMEERFKCPKCDSYRFYPDNHSPFDHEDMYYLRCKNCGHEEEAFGRENWNKLKKIHNVKIYSYVIKLIDGSVIEVESEKSNYKFVDEHLPYGRDDWLLKPITTIRSIADNKFTIVTKNIIYIGEGKL